MQSKQTNLPVRHAPKEQLLMIVQPQVRANKTVLRAVTELKSPGEINYCIPYRPVFSYTLLQGWFPILVTEHDKKKKLTYL